MRVQFINEVVCVTQKNGRAMIFPGPPYPRLTAYAPASAKRESPTSDDPKFNQPRGGNDMPRFGGNPTMMRLPQQDTAKGLDACFVGVPMDIGTSNRTGTRHGPRAIRAESAMMRPYNMATGAGPFAKMQVARLLGAID